VALAWPEDAKTDQVEDFIGIVRGRTVNSTRGRQQPPARGESADADRGGARRKPAPGRSAAGKSAGAKRTGKSGRGAPKNDRRGKPRRRS
jgi:hypothetical protein